MNNSKRFWETNTSIKFALKIKSDLISFDPKLIYMKK